MNTHAVLIMSLLFLYIYCNIFLMKQAVVDLFTTFISEVLTVVTPAECRGPAIILCSIHIYQRRHHVIIIE